MGFLAGGGDPPEQALDAVPASAETTVGDAYTLVLSGDITCDDAANWDAETKTYSYTPLASVSGTIKSVTFTAGGQSKTLKLAIFRDYSLATPYAGNPIMSPGDGGAYNLNGADAPYITLPQKIGDTYYALSQSASTNKFSWNQLSLYTSPDLLTWTAHASNPVIAADVDGWDKSYLLHPSIIKIGETWYCYYSACMATTNPGANEQALGLATSPDLLTWTKYGSEPIYRDTMVSAPCVIKIGATYYLYYWDHIHYGNARIYYATSADGVTWTKGASVLPRDAGDWDAGRSILDPWVVVNPAGIYEMVYTTYTGDQGYGLGWYQDLGAALSEDGVTWIKHQGAIRLPSNIPGAWDGAALGNGVPLFLPDGTLYLFFCGVNTSEYEYGGLDILPPPE